MLFFLRQRPARLVLAIAIAAFPTSALADEQVGGRQPPALTNLLVNVGIRIIDANAGRDLRRGQILGARMTDRCTLELTVSDMQPTVHRVALGDLRYVQGDARSMVEISTRRDHARSIIFELQPAGDDYAEVMFRLPALASECGAELAGPPPLIATPER